MSNGVCITKAVEMIGNDIWRNVMKLAKEFANQMVVGAFSDDLDPVACRQDHDLSHIVPADHGFQCRPQAVVTESEPFTEFNRRSLMAESDKCELHHWNVCRPPKTFAPKNVTRTPMKPTIDRYAAFLPRQPAIRR